MAESYNDITGDCLVSKANTKAYAAGYDAIFKPVPPESAKRIDNLVGDIEVDLGKPLNDADE